MNKLKSEKKEAVISALVEGNSVRSTERMTGVHRDTILRLLARVGAGCERLLDETMHDLTCERVQVDEIWSYVGKKRHLTARDNPLTTGDVWTFVALDADTKLVPCCRIGKRTLPHAKAISRAVLSSDALNAYVEASESAFGSRVDYGQIVKSYEAERIGPGRYSPSHVVAADRMPISGSPEWRHISTSYIERQNLTMRMSMRRFTRLTNAFSKKLDNLKAAVAVHFAHYNLVRIHRRLRVTPATAGVTDRLWSIGELLEEYGE